MPTHQGAATACATLAALAVTTAASAQPVTYDVEAEFLADASAMSLVVEVEDFDSAAWDHVRSSYPTMNVATTVTNLGVTWSTRPADAITTNLNWGRTGYGAFEFQTGTLQSSLLVGTSADTLYGVGVWINTNPDGGDIYIEIDGVAGEAVLIGSGHEFVGVIDEAGFSTFRIIDSENHTVWGIDDVAYARVTPYCAADLNADGNVDGADLATLLSAWGAAGSAADFNHDNTVNGEDLAYLLANWGACASA